MYIYPNKNSNLSSQLIVNVVEEESRVILLDYQNQKLGRQEILPFDILCIRLYYKLLVNARTSILIVYT